MTSSDLSAPVLQIDLGALADNYRRLSARARPAECAAALKADGYGVGSERAAATLAANGCKTFFVAHLSEGIRLRRVLAEETICILHGPAEGEEADYRQHHLTPVLNEPGQIERWGLHARTAGGLPACLHVDTGMNRLGLSEREARDLAAHPDRLAGIDIRFLVSHLAVAEARDEAMNAEQRRKFEALRRILPSCPASLANSSGIFLGPDYLYDLVRPGAALYGVNPTPGQPNPMREVVRLRAPILQIREIDTGESVGYGAAFRAGRPTRIATIPVGYADGYLRGFSNRASVGIAGVKAPIVGRVSMDLITVDVTDAPPEAVRVGSLVDVIGGAIDLDELAANGDTIGYEVLTSLGNRYRREYLADHPAGQ